MGTKKELEKNPDPDDQPTVIGARPRIVGPGGKTEPPADEPPPKPETPSGSSKR